MAQHPSEAHVIQPSNDPNFHNKLIYLGGGGWDEYCGAVFSPTVLSLYPKVKHYPGAVAYAVGYGELIALGENDKNLAAWCDPGWEPIG